VNEHPFDVEVNDQRLGHAHILYMRMVAHNISRNGYYRKKWQDCMREALNTHKNYIKFMEKRRLEKQRLEKQSEFLPHWQ
jgi:hypothetical protein